MRTGQKQPEKEWVKTFLPDASLRLSEHAPTLRIVDGYRLPYANEIRSYKSDGSAESDSERYETDILVLEEETSQRSKPRVVIEAKCSSITTHDAITYSHKASTHKQVHPYLRYGILIGDREQNPLPGRLFRHGAHFDFMLSWAGTQPTEQEFATFVRVLIDEVNASRLLEEIIFNSRSPKRKRFVCLHKPLRLE